MGFIAADPASGVPAGAGFEIDADQASPLTKAYYDNTAADDWVDGTGSGKGMFKLTPQGQTPTAAADCYGSNIDLDTATTDVKAFICDGNSDSKFSGKGGAIANEPEQNAVSPGGKTLDASWPIKATSNTPKVDVTHGYNAFRVGDSVCDQDDVANNLFLIAGGHRGDNEGTQFWGFEFNRVPPTGFSNLLANNGATFTLAHNRGTGDILVAFNNAGAGETSLELYRYEGGTYVLKNPAGGQPLPGCPSNMPLGNSELATTATKATPTTPSDLGHDAEAPPWKTPVCDPTGDGGGNTCRLAQGSASGGSGSHLVAGREDMEGVVDLTAFGITSPCFTSLLFTSRASDTVNADVKDVAGASVPLCGANIAISGTGVNEVNTPHEFTVNVTQSAGSVPGPAPNGTIATVTLTDDNANADPTIVANSCDNAVSAADTAAGAPYSTQIGTVNGLCKVKFVSSVPMVVTGSASATVNILGAQFPVSTNGQGGNSGPVIKRFVDLSVAISPNGINEVGSAHVFTITVTAFPSGATPVTFGAITPSVSGSPTTSTTCNSPSGTGNTRTCTFTVNSSTAGVFTANASASATMGGTTVTRSTAANSGPGGSGPATKRFVDASITITPSGVNGIGENHTFTVTATAIPAGATTVTFNSVTTSLSAAPTSQSGTCTNGSAPNVLVNANTASCSLTITNSTAATFTANAAVSVTFTDTSGSATVVRSTSGNAGPGGSGAVTKQFVDGSLKWVKHDDLGNLLGGAVFTVCRTHAFNSDTAAFDDITDQCFDVTDNSAPDVDPTGGEFELQDLALGTWTVKEKTPPAGYEADPDTETKNLTIAAPDGTIAVAFVDPRLFRVIVLVCRESDNTLHSSAVTFDGTEKQSLASNAALPQGVSQQTLCTLGGARYDGKKANNNPGYSGNVRIQ